MKKSLKTYHATKSYRGYTVLVYGERWENGYVDGVVVARARLSRDGKRIMNHGDYTPYLLDAPYTRTRYFNMGYAICAPQDTFSLEKGIEICKRRFKKDAMTAKSGLFLTDDMISAIIDNEVHYIINHWDKFNPDRTVWNIEEGVKAFEVEPDEEKENVTLTEEVTPVQEPTDCHDEKEECKEEEVKEKPVKGSFVGKYVYRKTDDGVNVVGLVSDEDEHYYYYLWRVRYIDNEDNMAYQFDLTNQNDVRQNKEDDVRLATPVELLDALKQIKRHTGLSWNGETKQFEG